MKEYNIEALWNEDIAPESQFSLGYLPGAIKSKLRIFGELKRVRNLFWWHWLMDSVAIVLGFILIIDYSEEVTIPVEVFALIYSGIAYYFYVSYFIKYIKGINKVPTFSIKEAIQSYYDTLCDYINRMYKLALILSVLVIIVRNIETLFGIEWNILGVILGLVALILGLAIQYAFIEGYFDYMYKDSKTEFEILLRELEDE